MLFIKRMYFCLKLVFANSNVLTTLLEIMNMFAIINDKIHFYFIMIYSKQEMQKLIMTLRLTSVRFLTEYNNVTMEHNKSSTRNSSPLMCHTKEKMQYCHSIV